MAVWPTVGLNLDESQYIEMDLKHLTSVKLRLLAVLNHDEQSQDDIVEKSGLSKPYVCYMIEQFQDCIVITSRYTLTGYGYHLKAAAFPEMDTKVEP